MEKKNPKTQIRRGTTFSKKYLSVFQESSIDRYREIDASRCDTLVLEYPTDRTTRQHQSPVS